MSIDLTLRQGSLDEALSDLQKRIRSEPAFEALVGRKCSPEDLPEGTLA